MSSAQSWQELPEHVTRQAAPEMLPGVEWHYYKRRVENPTEEECRAKLTEIPEPDMCGLDEAAVSVPAEIFNQFKVYILGYRDPFF